MSGVNANGKPDWDAVADAFCRAWTTDDGTPDFEALSGLYAPDPDVVIYDSLAPLAGFRGFEELRSSIYDGLASLSVRRLDPVISRALAGGAVVVGTYLMRFAYRFSDGRGYDFDARITQVWERRDQRYWIVHEHPSTVLPE